MPTAITDSKFADLKAKLRELFELDKSDLDFGIYRIMAAKNKDVNEFLDRQLKDVVRGALAAHGAGATDLIQADLDKAIQQAEALGAEPDTLPKVKELKAKLGTAGGASAAELEADIYNHLLAFFSRYYDEGDFISKRRYKGDVYAIPYGGEEVTLYWANKDQYYIKSGEWHKDYRFKVGGKTVHFKLVEATQEASNNKEPDDAKRRYVLVRENPVESTDGELILRFEFRVPTEAEKATIPEATRIFGGKYAAPTGRTKGDEREQFCADAEQRALAAVPEAWKSIVTALAATDTKPARTLLGKHVDYFSARNTFDYFIHKDLGGFLKRELDFYIKNEVVRLDDLEALPGDHLARVQGKIKAIRGVAGRIIDFLASIEDFQKKMWLKKKLVLGTNWLVTVDRIPAKMRGAVAANTKQWEEWEALGFEPADDDTLLLNRPKWGTRDYLDANDKLVVDTRLFGDDFSAFKAEVLASEEPKAGAESFDDATTGLLIHSENFQALRATGARFAEQTACIYADPPYNTNEATFLYKNSYLHSSWLAMVEQAASASYGHLRRDGVFCCAIDDFEQPNLAKALDRAIGVERRLGTLVVESKPSGRTNDNFLATSHEYLLFYSPEPTNVEITFFPLTDEQEAQYAERDETSAYKWRDFLRTGGLSTPEERPNSYYPIYYLPTENALSLEFIAGGVEILPIDSEGKRRVWRKTPPSFERHLQAGEIRAVKNRDGKYKVQIIDRIKAGTRPKSIWSGEKYDASSHGTKLLKNIMGDKDLFSFPKSLHAVRDALWISMGDSSAGLSLDCFAGSGTTGHAVVNLNREDGGDRRFILIEMGTYFDTVLKPRIAKVLYSPDWKNGKAQVHGKGTSALVKYFTLESYEDALNNLPAPTGELLANADPATKDALITYSLDLEMGPSLLNLEAFSDPWGYAINAQPAGEAEIKPHRVDLVETFNYLLGLKVRAYGALERYTADFAQAEHADNLGRLKVAGRMRRDKDGPFVFQRVEGELLDGTRILVVWRKLTDDAEKDAAALEAWMARHREETKERSEYRDYHLIYINGPVTLPQPTAEIRTVLPIEQTFKDRMFADGGEA